MKEIIDAFIAKIKTDFHNEDWGFLDLIRDRTLEELFPTTENEESNYEPLNTAKEHIINIQDTLDEMWDKDLLRGAVNGFVGLIGISLNKLDDIINLPCDECCGSPEGFNLGITCPKCYKPFRSVNQPKDRASAGIYTEQDMTDCFAAGVKFARDMDNNPSNTEYIMSVRASK